MAVNKADLRARLKASTASAVKNRGKAGGGMFSSILKMPPETKLWKCTAGQHLIDIIPFVVGYKFPTKSAIHDNIVHGESIVGFLDIHHHNNVGPKNDNKICMARAYGKPCPQCEQRQELFQETVQDKKKLEELRPKYRNFINLICLDSDETEAAGLQVWEAAHYFVGKHILAQSELPRGGGTINYADPEEGLSFFFERIGTGSTNTEFTGHRFLPREHVYDMEIIFDAPQLDNFLDIPFLDEEHPEKGLDFESYYDEVYEMHWGHKPQQPNGQANQVRVANVDTAPEEGEDKPAASGKVYKKTKSEAKAEPEPETKPEPEPETKPEPEPEAKTEQPVRRTRAKTEAAPAEDSKGTCPAGGTFGEEGSMEACLDCKVWDACVKEQDRKK